MGWVITFAVLTIINLIGVIDKRNKNRFISLIFLVITSTFTIISIESLELSSELKNQR